MNQKLTNFRAWTNSHWGQRKAGQPFLAPPTQLSGWAFVWLVTLKHEPQIRMAFFRNSMCDTFLAAQAYIENAKRLAEFASQAQKDDSISAKILTAKCCTNRALIIKIPKLLFNLDLQCFYVLSNISAMAEHNWKEMAKEEEKLYNNNCSEIFGNWEKQTLTTEWNYPLQEWHWIASIYNCCDVLKKDTFRLVFNQRLDIIDTSSIFIREILRNLFPGIYLF